MQGQEGIDAYNPMLATRELDGVNQLEFDEEEEAPQEILYYSMSMVEYIMQKKQSAQRKLIDMDDTFER